jgi:hypothetical protein
MSCRWRARLNRVSRAHCGAPLLSRCTQPSCGRRGGVLPARPRGVGAGASKRFRSAGRRDCCCVPRLPRSWRSGLVRVYCNLVPQHLASNNPCWEAGPHQGSRHALQRQMAARQDFLAGLHGRGCPLLAAHNACTVIAAQCRGLVSLLSLRRAEASIPRLQRRHLARSYQFWFKYEWRALTLKTWSPGHGEQCH